MPPAVIKNARRFDAGEVSGVEISPQGYLRMNARITRTGVFTYRDACGGIRRELRRPDEVFNADALESFALAPLTNLHPGEKLSPANTAKYQVGTVANPRPDGEFIAARVQVTDAAAIDAINAGRRELSCGYVADLEFTPGITAGIDGVPDGLRYDAIQRNIRGNHVALVDAGRAGPEASLRLDESDAVMIDDGDPLPDPLDPDKNPETPRASAPDRKAKKMDTKIKIDGVEFEVSESAGQAMAKVMDRETALKADLAEAKAAIETERARADAAEESRDAEKKAREDAEDPAKIREAISARLTLERAAAPILGSEVKIDTMTDAEIKRAVAVKAAKDPDVAAKRLDGCDPAYLQARYDAAIESWEKKPEANGGLVALRRQVADTRDPADPNDARNRMIEANRKAGRDSLN